VVSAKKHWNRTRTINEEEAEEAEEAEQEEAAETGKGKLLLCVCWCVCVLVCVLGVEREVSERVTHRTRWTMPGGLQLALHQQPTIGNRQWAS
jgi:hypothetical protein